MSNEIDQQKAQRCGQKGRKVALGLKIALGQVGADDTVISEDEKAQALFDLGFEYGSGESWNDCITIMQGLLAGIEQRLLGPANDNQGELDLERE